MSAACLLVGALALPLPDAAFTLSWTHSVERTGWRESWRVSDGGLRLVEAAVQGSGAGMEAGEGAHREGAWFVWQPDLPPLPQIALAASGTTGAGWTLCSAGVCHDIGSNADAAIVVRPC